MVKLILGDTHLSIIGADDEQLKAIDEVTSYPVKDAWFSSAYRSKRWDGKEHLMTYSKRNGYRVHAGCASDVLRQLDDMGWEYKYKDARNPVKTPVDHGWTGKILNKATGELVDIEVRDYQGEAARAVLTTQPVGRCMVRMPIRSGKTVLAGVLIHTIGARTLFMTTSDLLLNQTADLYRSMFSTEIGIVGAGTWNPTDLTIATIQTLASKAKAKDGELEKFLDSFDVVIFDECHHLKAEKWKQIALAVKARWKIGLSATIHLDNKKPNERENIWLKACTGDVVYSVTTKYLIDEGWLLKPNIEIYTYKAKPINGDWAEDNVYGRGIVKCKPRNAIIIDKALEAAADGASVMVMAREHAHIDLLFSELEARGASVEKLTGQITGTKRFHVVKRFKNGKTSILVGNVFGEGVDIPQVDVVINAEGGESKTRTIQRMRNLTPSPGKDVVRVIDFQDTHNPYLKKHAKRRMATYESENAFDIQVF